LSDKVWQKKQNDRWLRLLRSGDHQAFAEFIDKYKETVFLCCRTLGLQDVEAEDVASETFLAAYKGLRKYTGKAKLSTWLWVIAYRKAVNHLRKNRKLRQLKAEPEKFISGIREQEPPAAVQSKETEKIIWQAVENLPKLWAMTVMLFYREEKSITDIAKIMRVKENTIKTYLFRSREKLKQTLSAAFGENIDVNG